jgi:hypothetical protein
MTTDQSYWLGYPAETNISPPPPIMIRCCSPGILKLLPLDMTKPLGMAASQRSFKEDGHMTARLDQVGAIFCSSVFIQLPIVTLSRLWSTIGSKSATWFGSRSWAAASSLLPARISLIFS